MGAYREDTTYIDDIFSSIKEQNNAGKSKEQARNEFKKRYRNINNINLIKIGILEKKMQNLNLMLKLMQIKETSKSGLNKAEELVKKVFDPNIVQETIGKINNELERIFGKDKINIIKNLDKDAFNGSWLGLLYGLTTDADAHIIKSINFLNIISYIPFNDNLGRI